MTSSEPLLPTIPAHRSLADLLADSARRHPDHIALSWNDQSLRYGELQARVVALAAAWSALGIGRGERVALVLPNTPTYVMAFYALMRLGAVVVNVSPGSQGSELAHILRDSGAVAVVTLDVFLPGLYKALPESAVKHLFITSVQGLEKRLPLPEGVPPPRPFEELMRPPPGAPAQAPAPAAAPPAPPSSPLPPAPPVGADELAVLQYTSGSTGAPKAAMLSHRGVLASVAQSDAWMTEPQPPNIPVLCVIPFFHVFGLTIGLNLGIAKAYRLILIPRLDALDLMPLIRLIEAQRPVSFPAVPSLWAALLSHPGVTAEILRPVRVPASGGAPLPSWVQDKFRALTGRPIYEAYGLSEASGATHSAPFPEGGPAGSIGRPLGAIEARLVDPSDPDGEREVAPGQPDAPDAPDAIGELVVRGEPVMMGYFQNPELTARVLRNGWLRTGDLARRDADGFYYIVDRKDDLIITSGYNLYPSEIEAVILRHPAVKDVAVVGVPDRLRGQVARAHVVVKEGASVTADELLALCRDNLSPHKVPRFVVFTDSVPRNPAGKTVRKGLRDPET
jgi:long-chain acyl-CoA synthetase